MEAAIVTCVVILMMFGPGAAFWLAIAWLLVEALIYFGSPEDE